VTSPLPTVTVTPAAASTATSVVSVNPGTILANGVTQVKLQAKDAFGNNETAGGLTVTFALGTGTAGGGFGAVTDNGNGTYTATFTGTTAGTSNITAKIGASTVASQPAVTVVAGSVDFTKSTVTLSSATDPSGTPITVTLHTKDASGNNLNAGGLTVIFSLVNTVSGGQGSYGGVTDNGDGPFATHSLVETVAKPQFDRVILGF
jgi:hypothetical protein